MQFVCPFVCISCSRHAESAVSAAVLNHNYKCIRSHPTDKKQTYFCLLRIFYEHLPQRLRVSPLWARDFTHWSSARSSWRVYNIDFECGFKKGQRASLRSLFIKLLRLHHHSVGTWSTQNVRGVEINNKKYNPKFNGEFVPSKWVCKEGHEWNCVAHWL